MALKDADFLDIVGRERQNSIGFDNDAELTAQRIQALEYYKGEMSDVPALKNRSKAVSTDVADTIETILPDLVEIFTGGDDVAAFRPNSPDDEKAAQQETDYINHVFYNENPGFLILYSMFKDALQVKTGIATWYWEDDVYDEDEIFEGKTAVEVQLAAQDGEVADLKQDKPEDSDDPQAQPGEPTYSFTLKRIKTPGKVCIETFDPQDFTIAQDAMDIATATYCAMRSRPRVQDLIADGVSREICDQLPPYGTRKNDGEQQARDTVQENSQPVENDNDLRQVEVVKHFIRVDADGDGEPELWKVETGADETVLISREKVNQANFAAITPYIVTHRFYGESVADKLLEIQRIKTALTRMAMDSGYFAVNQRPVVDMSQASEFTIGDLLANEPGRPVRVRGQNVVTPMQGAGLSFDAFGALEYFSVQAEQRTGIVRNAQGLNPDTLHDTAKGAMALMNAAQKRVRLIAKIFAETGIKDLFLGIHATIRENATKPQMVRLRKQWVPVDPSKWAERNDMSIEIGVGASGDLGALQTLIGLQMQVATEQGGLSGPLLTAPNAFNLLEKLTQKIGFKNATQFWTDPADPNTPQQPQKPDPAAIKAQSDLQIAQMKAQFQQQTDKYKADLDAQMTKYQIDQEVAAKLRIAGIESITDMATTAHTNVVHAHTAHNTAKLKAQSQVSVGGEPG